MKKTKAEALQTREALLLSALNTFYENGVAQTSLNQIASNAGVTRGAFYWHFRNKEDLFEALFAWLCQEALNNFQHDLARNAEESQGLRNALINALCRLQNDEKHEKFCTVLHLKCEHTANNQAINTISAHYHKLWDKLIEQAIAHDIAHGFLPSTLNPSLAKHFLHANIFGLIDRWLRYRDEVGSLANIAPVFIDATLAALHTPHLQLNTSPN
ncbi:MAG: TetR family transcriptional regulator [Neisseria sp.]|nr:TetR family transcriptional regulator [Neisseria sp.]